MKSDSVEASTHTTSMSSWVEKMREISRNDDFVSSILSEEASKVMRLRSLSSEIGLPIYEIWEFKLPYDIKQYSETCKNIVRDGWKIALRFSEYSSYTKPFFRQLDTNLNKAMFVANKYCKQRERFIARVTPYRVSERSGTLWINKSNSILELVFGPHVWISKMPPKNEKIYTCLYTFPHISVQYTTGDAKIREILFSCFKDVLYIILGCNLRELADNNFSVYSEFHWYKDLGYRFIECSFSHAWTSDKRTEKYRSSQFGNY